jgi:hypothetical protein
VRSLVKYTLSILMPFIIGFSASLAESTSKPRTTEPQVCFSVREAGQVASSLVESLQRMKQLEAELLVERAKRPARFGWTLGGGVGIGYDFIDQQPLVTPVIALTWGIRF